MPNSSTLNKRRKPSQRRSKETVDVILTGAEKVLVKYGYNKATTNRIAEVSGVSIGSLYQYFDNKEEIIGALAEKHCNLMKDHLKSTLMENASSSIPDMVRVTVTSILEINFKNRELKKVLFAEIPRTGKMAEIDAVHDEMVDLVTMFLNLKSKDLRIKNLEVAAFVVVHGVFGILFSLIQKDQFDHEEAINEIIDLVLRYIS